MEKMMHKSVLLEESIECLNIQQGSVVVDATLGGGGHSNRILESIGADGKLVAIDQDAEAVENFRNRLPEGSQNVYCVKDNFANLKNILHELEIDSVDAVLADLGYSSIQLEDEKRGMSFLLDAPLDMRLDKEGELTAGYIINHYPEDEIRRILKDYGEEQFAGSIARKICQHRKSKEIETTGELVGIIKESVPKRNHHGKIHVATKTFQALRIETNRELEVLEKFVPSAIDSLKKGGRLVIISFHSLEDRIVKNIFRQNAKECVCPTDFPVCRCGQTAKVKIITKKPIIPGESEIAENPRARSAKLRICEKI